MIRKQQQKNGSELHKIGRHGRLWKSSISSSGQMEAEKKRRKRNNQILNLIEN